MTTVIVLVALAAMFGAGVTAGYLRARGMISTLVELGIGASVSCFMIAGLAFQISQKIGTEQPRFIVLVGVACIPGMIFILGLALGQTLGERRASHS